MPRRVCPSFIHFERGRFVVCIVEYRDIAISHSPRMETLLLTSFAFFLYKMNGTFKLHKASPQNWTQGLAFTFLK